VPPPDPRAHQLWDEYPPVDLYDVHIRQATHKFHPDLPPSIVWGFDGLPMGPTFVANYGEPYLVRYHNDLPPFGDGTGFGKPETTIHLHNAHTASESDGFPGDFFPPGTFKDNHYTMFYAGHDERESLGTLWYHDHRVDFTAQSTYKGLTGFTIFYDEKDSGDERDPNPEALHLPSGEYDVVLQLADKRFAKTPDRALFMDIFNTDGFLGDQYTVNAVVQPYFEVAARKYRFRILNVGPSRFYRVALSDGSTMWQIANDGNLLERPLERDHVRITVAERMDVIVDFSKYPIGTELYLVNIEDQINGKGPTGKVLELDEGVKMMKFIVNRTAPDFSVVSEKLREINRIDESEIVRTRRWVFDNINGIWTINDKPFDFTRVDAIVEQGTAERWHIINAAEDWEHPVHIHVEEHQIVTRNGKPPTPDEQGRKDVTVLGPGDEIEIDFRFRDFLGKYPIHCHNTVHEDHAMMARWDIVPPR